MIVVGVIAIVIAEENTTEVKREATGLTMNQKVVVMIAIVGSIGTNEEENRRTATKEERRKEMIRRIEIVVATTLKTKRSPKYVIETKNPGTATVTAALLVVTDIATTRNGANENGAVTAAGTRATTKNDRATRNERRREKETKTITTSSCQRSPLTLPSL